MDDKVNFVKVAYELLGVLIKYELTYNEIKEVLRMCELLLGKECVLISRKKCGDSVAEKSLCDIRDERQTERPDRT